jgi:hypothetical protein
MIGRTGAPSKAASSRATPASETDATRPHGRVDRIFAEYVQVVSLGARRRGTAARSGAYNPKTVSALGGLRGPDVLGGFLLRVPKPAGVRSLRLIN